MEQNINLDQEPVIIQQGGGAVNSVNGQTGDVVLTTSDLENTSDYQTGNEVQNAIDEAVSQIDIPTKVSELQNDSGFQTAQQVANAVAGEASLREAADTNLQGQIDAITASSDVTDIVGTYADLQNYDTSTLGNNDIIKVLQDESQNDETTYYRWSTTTQSFTLIGEEGPYYTKSAADQKFQDKLTAGSNISINANNEISATDTTYSDFTGTDGQTAGTAGLVPAPATTDADKFLKSDGTWDTAGGGGVPTIDLKDIPNNKINVDTLDAGFYKITYTGESSQLTGGVIFNGTAVLQNYINKDRTTLLQVIDDRYNKPHKIGLVFADEGSNNSPYLWLWVASYDRQRTSVIFDDKQTAVALGQGSSTGYDGQIAIGRNARAIGSSSEITVIGENAQSSESRGTALGAGSNANSRGGVALGAYSTSSVQGEVNIGSSSTNWGYNSTNYRVIRGVHDGEQDHDATTLGQLNARIVGSGTAAPTTSTVGSVGSLYAYVESGTGHLAICTAADASTSTYTWQTLV